MSIILRHFHWKKKLGNVSLENWKILVKQIQTCAIHAARSKMSRSASLLALTFLDTNLNQPVVTAIQISLVKMPLKDSSVCPNIIIVPYVRVWYACCGGHLNSPTLCVDGANKPPMQCGAESKYQPLSPEVVTQLWACLAGHSMLLVVEKRSKILLTTANCMFFFCSS